MYYTFGLTDDELSRVSQILDRNQPVILLSRIQGQGEIFTLDKKSFHSDIYFISFGTTIFIFPFLICQKNFLPLY